MQSVPASVIGAEVNLDAQHGFVHRGNFAAPAGHRGLIAGPLVTTVLLLLSGCSSGRMNIIDLNFRRLPADARLIEAVNTDECFWWIEDNSVRIAMRRSRPGLFSRLHRQDTSLSLVLPGLPANRARDYQLDIASMRAYLRQGTRHERFGSTSGIVSIEFAAGKSLTGRFRLTARRQVFNILTGWSDAGSVVMTGEFRARNDTARGQAILELTEEDGMERDGAGSLLDRTHGRPREVTGPPVRRKN